MIPRRSATTNVREKIDLPFLLVLLIAVFFRVWNLNSGLPAFYEEGIPLRKAIEFWRAGAPGFSFDPNFFVYPALTFYFQFVLQAIHFLFGSVFGIYHGAASFSQTYVNDPTAFVLIGRVTSVAFDLGIVILAYVIGKEALDKQAGLLAAFLVAINPLQIEEAHIINVDTPLAFFSVLAVYLTLRALRNPTRRAHLLLGLAVGLAAATKYNGAVLGILLFLPYIYSRFARQDKPSTVPIYLPVYALAVSIGIFVISNPYIFIRFGDFLQSFSGVQEHMERGHLGLDSNMPTALYYILDRLPAIMGWPALLVGLVTLAFLFRPKKISFVTISIFPIVYFMAICTWSMRADRYFMPIVPLLLVVCAIGTVQAFDVLDKRKFLNDGSSKVRTALLSVATMLLSIAPLMGAVRVGKSLARPDTRTEATNWIRQHVPKLSAFAMGPFGIELKKDPYFVVTIPFNAGRTESTIPYFATTWYGDIDYFVMSDFDYGRYKLEPERFKEILAFFDTIQHQWNLVRSFEAGDTLQGPSFWIYQPRNGGDSLDQRKIDRALRDATLNELLPFAGTLGLIEFEREKYAKSEQLMKVALTLDPANLVALKRLALSQRRLERNDEAIASANEYLKLSPRDPEVLLARAEALCQVGRAAEGERDFYTALEINPRIEGAYLGLNILYMSRGDGAKMAAILTRYLSILPPDSPKADEVRELLRHLSSGG